MTPWTPSRCSQWNQSEALGFRPPLSLEPRPGAPWPWNGVTHLGLPALYGNGGCARQTSRLGESYCLTHPCPPGEVQGSLKWTKRYRVWGRTPASTKAHWKKHDCSFLRSWDLFDFWVHIHTCRELADASFMFTEVHKMSHRDILAQVGGNHAGLRLKFGKKTHPTRP